MHNNQALSIRSERKRKCLSQKTIIRNQNIGQRWSRSRHKQLIGSSESLSDCIRSGTEKGARNQSRSIKKSIYDAQHTLCRDPWIASQNVTAKADGPSNSNTF